MPDILALMFCIACDLAPTAPMQMAQAGEVEVDVELVLAVDVSRSMDPEEFVMQRQGYAAALRDPDFLKAVASGVHGRIALAYFEWAGTARAETLVSWALIDGAASADAFARKIEERSYNHFRGTSISSALTYGAGLFDTNGFSAWRQVIDVSGDGPNNLGTPVTSARDAAVEKGIVVNGLPILVRPSQTVQELDRYYAECVTGGPGSFVLPIRDTSEFATAIRRKLILEVSDTGHFAPVIPVQATEPIDCLRGERDRRFLTDPYFPELGP